MLNDTEQILCPRCGAKLIDGDNITVGRTHLEAESFRVNTETKTLDYYGSDTIEQGGLFCLMCDLDVEELLEGYTINY